MAKNLLRCGISMFLLILIAATAGCGFKNIMPNREIADFNQTLPLGTGGRFQLNNINGNITVVTWDQPSVIIHAEKKAPTLEELDAIKIEVVQDGNHIQVNTRYPRWEPFRSTHGEVNYHITVPKEAKVQLESVNGQIQADGAGQELHAKTVNGGIEITESRGSLSAETVNGGIHATLRNGINGDCNFSATNGSISIRVEDNINARFEGHTVNGGIHTNLPLSTTGMIAKNLSGQIGNGGCLVRMNTVNGGISINRF
jgi:hypothetical protein